jgi:Flp pilus assembly CpaE family ATPase
MIEEISKGHRTAEMFRQLAQHLTGRSEARKSSGRFIPPALGKLFARKA